MIFSISDLSAGTWSVAVWNTSGQWIPKYSWTRMFLSLTMSGQGTEQ